ncbi:MAG: lipid biosynthesis B12-binding/radical SAM protein [Thermodesulfobacteriota bacterium]
MNVLLLSANTLTEPYPVYPLGLDYVAAALRPGHRVRIADMNILGDGESLIREVLREPPEVIGISLRNADNTDAADPKSFLREYREVIALIRRHSSALIVLGGSGFTIFPEQFMEELDADYGIVGEGERMALLLDAIEHGGDAATIPGVVGRRTRAWKAGPWERPFVRDFNSRSEHLGFYLKKGGMLNIQTQRGCHFKCIYCTYPHVEGRSLRLLPPAEVARTALDLQRAGARYLFITDSAFNADIDHSMAVARAFKEAGLKIPWGAFFAPVGLPADYFRCMAEAGLTHVEFGTESLADPVLAAYRKPFRKADIFEAHRAAVAAGLFVAHYFLLGGPGESSGTIAETLADVDKLKRTVLFFFCGMRIYPNTALYDLAGREGLIGSHGDILHPVFYRNKALEAIDIIGMVQLAARQRPNWVVGSGGGDTARVIARLYERGYTGPLWEHLIR